MDADIKPIKFLFRYLNARGEQMLFTRKGGVDQQGVSISGRLIPYSAIAGALQAGAKLTLLFDPGQVPETLSKRIKLDDGVETITVHVFRGKAKAVRRLIDRMVSALEAEARRQELTRAGEGRLFRAVICPDCQSTIDLSKLEGFNYIYCPYCENIYDHALNLVDPGERRNLCDDCGLFDQVKDYAEFYFYHFLVIFGISLKPRRLCPSCALKMGLKMLGLNFLFVVGITPSLWALVKSRLGRDDRMKTLGQANRLALEGRYQEATPLYQEVLGFMPRHPGVLYSQALGHLIGDDLHPGKQLLREALQSCPNYLPAEVFLREMEE